MTRWLTEWLPRIVARAPVTIHKKLLAAFLSMVVLLIVVGAVSLEVLGGVNRRVEELVTLQRKIAAYRQLHNDTTTQLYSVTSALLVPEDRTLEATVGQLIQFGYDFDRLQFVAKDEVQLLAEVRKEYDQLTQVVAKVVELIRAGKVREGQELHVTQAGPLADRMERLTNQLVNRAEADMVASIETSREALLTSQRIVIGSGVASIALALLLGYTISSSLIRPVKQMDARFNQIALGDFSRQIEVPNRDELGSLAANLNRMNDELGRLYQQLEAANLAKSRFLATASHDLRQPLHALWLFVAQLRSKANPADHERIVGQIEAAVAAMDELFNALLDISKLDAGVLSTDLTEFPMGPLLEQIESTFSGAANERNLRLRVVPTGAWVRSDRVLLERILLNLTSNAIHYTEHGGVVIGCRPRGPLLRIEVWDSGSGIAENQRQNIFGEFYRIPNVGDRRGGLGLGLSIVDRLCRLLEHPLELISMPGKGSRFTVVVPLCARQPILPVSDAQSRVTVDPLPGNLVVVVDDDVRVLEGMNGLLRSWDCRVIATTSGNAALAMISEHGGRPDVIISDYQLPSGETGVEVINRLRAACGARIPGCLISGDTSPERLRDAKESGYLLLHKPVRPMTLRATLSQLLKRSLAETGA